MMPLKKFFPEGARVDLCLFFLKAQTQQGEGVQFARRRKARALVFCVPRNLASSMNPGGWRS